MEVETILLLVRQASCALIVWLLFSYRPDDRSRWKMMVSLAASCVSGLAMALMMFTAYFWHKQMNAWYLPWLTLAMFLIALRLFKTRGNMSLALKLKKAKSYDTP